MSVDPRAGSNSTSLSSEDDYHFFYKFMVGTKLILTDECPLYKDDTELIKSHLIH